MVQSAKFAKSLIALSNRDSGPVSQSDLAQVVKGTSITLNPGNEELMREAVIAFRALDDNQSQRIRVLAWLYRALRVHMAFIPPQPPDHVPDTEEWREADVGIVVEVEQF